MKKVTHSKVGKKLAAYSAVATAVLALGQKADAQIVYTDVDPDETFTGASYNLDLNNDGTTDFILEQNSWYNGWQTIRIFPQGNAGFISTQYQPASTWSSYIFAQALDSGVEINGSAPFNSSSGNSTMSLGFAGTLIAGPWIGQTEKFLGLRFTLDGGSTFNYGWARVSVNGSATEFTIHDYAYESSADTPINAGEGIPVLPLLSDLSVTNIGSDAADVLFTPSVDGDAYYVVLLESETAPIAAEVVAGTGSGGAAAVFAGDMSVTGGTEATANLTGLTAGSTYTVYLVLDDGIVKTLSAVYDVDFSTSTYINALKDVNINVFPNPSTGFINIDTDLKNFNVSVKDMTGRTIINAGNIRTVDLSGVASGNYIIQISNDAGSVTKRIVIE